MKRVRQVSRKLLVLAAFFSILVQSMSQFLFVLPKVIYAEGSEQPVAEEQIENTIPTQDEPIVTPAPEEQTQITPTETPAPIEEISPAQSENAENVTPTETPTPAEEVSLPPSENVTPVDSQTPSEVTLTVLENQENNNSPNEKLSVVLLDNVSAVSLDLGAIDLETAGNGASATLTTDKADYAPTDTALITGSSLLPNTTYTLRVWSDDEPPTSTTIDVTSNDSGTFVYAYQLDGAYRPNYKVELKDSIGIVVATTTFTDSRTIESATVDGGSTTVVTPGAIIPVEVNATTTSDDDWESTSWRISTTAPGSMTCANTSDETSSGTFTKTFNITAPTAPGVYNAYFRIHDGNSCGSSGQSSVLTLNNAVTVTGPDLTATKTNNVGGNATINQVFTWTIRVQNSGAATATFSNNQDVLWDERPSTGVSSYGTPTITTSGTTGSFDCTQSGTNSRDLVCEANGAATMPAGSYIDIAYTVTPSAVGALSNPRSGQSCEADDDNVVTESDETNNDCTDTVTVNLPDTTPPTDPADVNSTSHEVDTSSSDNTITMLWTVAGSAPGATDSESGVDGYSYEFSNSSSTTPNIIKNAEESATGTTPSSFALADGSWYFHLRTRDNAGNWTSTVHVGPFVIDTTDPETTIDSGPSGDVSSTDATFTFSSNDDSATFECQLDGGGFSACSSPQSYSSLGEGSHTLDVKATDTAGNPDLTPDSQTWTVDTLAPADPSDFETSPELNTPSTNTGMSVSWPDEEEIGGASDNSGSGVSGYSVEWTQDEATLPNETVNLDIDEDTVSNFTATANGDWWFHLRTMDTVGNWTSTVHVGPFIIDTISPTLESAETQDSNENGKIDGILLSFSENINDSFLNVGEPDGWDVIGYSGEAIGTGESENDNRLLLTFDEGESFDTGATPTITYTPSVNLNSTHDTAGNQLESLEVASDDKASPVLVSAVTQDTEPNGQIDRVFATFSEDLNDDSVTSDKFEVSGYSIFNVFLSGNVVEIILEENSFNDTGARPDVSVFEGDEGEVLDVYGNEALETAVTASDGAAPVSTIDSPEEGLVTNDPIEISGTSSDGTGDTVLYVKLFYRESVDEEEEENEWAEIPESQRDNENVDEPYEWSYSWTPDEDGTYDIKAEATDDAGNSETSPTVTGIVYDTTAPEMPSADPAAGDYTSDQEVTLESSDSLSGLADIFYTIDGSTPDNTSTIYTDPIAVGTDTIIKAVAYDIAGNPSDILTAEYGIAPVISGETSGSVTDTSVTITWATDDLATSRVLYDTISHPDLGAAPNYGYASSTVEDAAKVLAHSVAVSGLTAGTTYFYRTVSHGSPEAASDEKSFATTSAPSSTSSSSDGGSVAGASTSCGDTAPGSAPALLSAISGANSVTLTWSQASDPVSYYLITYGTSAGAQTYGNPDVGGKGTTSYIVSGLSGGTTYYFKVRAGNGCKPGDFSNELSATPGGGTVIGPATGFEEGVLGTETNPTQETLGAEKKTAQEKSLGANANSGWIKVVGGLFVLVLIISLYWFFRRRMNRQGSST